MADEDEVQEEAALTLTVPASIVVQDREDYRMKFNVSPGAAKRPGPAGLPTPQIVVMHMSADEVARFEKEALYEITFRKVS